MVGRSGACRRAVGRGRELSGVEPVPAPIRTCVGCRARRPATELVRFVADSAGRLVAGRSAAGRGAWLCPDRACWDRAASRNAWSRALRRRTVVPADPDDGLGSEGFRRTAQAD